MCMDGDCWFARMFPTNVDFLVAGMAFIISFAMLTVAVGIGSWTRRPNMSSHQSRHFKRVLAEALEPIDVRLARIERLIRILMRDTLDMEKDVMALRATDQALIEEVHRTQDVQLAANKALTQLVQTNVDLTQKLADAIADSGAADDAEVQAALTALKESNEAQVAATPALSTAVANTDPNAPVATS